MIIAVAKLELFLSETHSLKEKRQIVKRITGRTAEKFGVHVAEVDHQDLWQRAALGFALVGSDRRFLKSLMDQMITFIENLDMAQVLERNEELIEMK